MSARVPIVDDYEAIRAGVANLRRARLQAELPAGVVVVPEPLAPMPEFSVSDILRLMKAPPEERCPCPPGGIDLDCPAHGGELGPHFPATFRSAWDGST